MAKIEIEGVFAGISNQNELLRIELLNVVHNEKGAWYVVYWENVLDISKEECHNKIVFEDGGGIFVHSFNPNYGYKVFSGAGRRINALNFIENNNEFILLKQFSKFFKEV